MAIKDLFEDALKQYVPHPVLAVVGAVTILVQFWEPLSKLTLPSRPLVGAVTVFCVMLAISVGAAIVAWRWLGADVSFGMQTGLVAGLLVGLLAGLLFGRSAVLAAHDQEAQGHVVVAFGRWFLPSSRWAA